MALDFKSLSRALLGAGLCVAALLPATAAADPVCDGLSAKGRRYLARTHAPGLAIGVVQNGRIVCSIVLGASASGGPRITPDTNFHLASVSKTVVAVAVMRLASRGRLSIDAPVVTYLPGFRLADPRYRAINVRHVLTHMSGLPDVEDYGWSRPQLDDGALGRYVASLARTRLVTEPGATFHYSNVGYEVLGEIVARVSGMSFETYVETQLFRPAGLRRSSFLFDPAVDVSFARPHVADGRGGVRESPVYPYSRTHGPSSTLHSNIRDMSRWMIALMPGRSSRPVVLPRRAWASMRVPLAHDIVRDQPDLVSPGFGMGLGWFLIDRGNRVLMAHPGQDVGFKSLLLIDPASRAGIIMMTNADTTDPEEGDGVTPAYFGLEEAQSALDRLAARSGR